MREWSLGRALVLGVVLVALAGGGGLWLFVRRAQAQIDASGLRARDLAAARVEQQVEAELGRASAALEQIRGAVESGAVSHDDAAGVEALLYGVLAADAHLEEATFTRAESTGFDAAGDALVEERPRWQLSIVREPSGALPTSLVCRGAAGFERTTRARGPGDRFDAAPFGPPTAAADPTEHATFSVLASRGGRGRPIWSDLHLAEIDAALPEAARRVVVSVQRNVTGPGGRLLGVVRVAIVSAELDAIATRGSRECEGRVVLLAASRPDGAPRTRLDLVARVDPSDRFLVVGADDLRLESARPPPEVAALLGSDVAAGLDPARPVADGALDVGAEPWAATLRPIGGDDARSEAAAAGLGGGGTRGWLVAVLAPRSLYTRELDAFRRTFVLAMGAALALALALAVATIVAIRRGLRAVVTTTQRMRRFDFARGGAATAFREVREVTDGLERAKTVVRAMERYVPLGLVRRLYQENEEPRLGGELHEVTLLFTDIEGFTSLSERLPPAELARRLGEYLEVMTRAVEATEGTIDKYIGDAVMAFWNAPSPVEHHARRACEAVLACRRAAKALYDSPAWGGLAPLVTRHGVHTAKVMVGHFGAPTRLAYTALGDGVNLAARLESLCKHYGVLSLVSDDARAAAGDAFVFRRIDRVAVKGKTRGVDVFELLGDRGDDALKVDDARAYERAFEAYLERRFERAIELLGPQVDRDRPSAVLLARCEALRAAPPPEGWDGVHVASSK